MRILYICHRIPYPPDKGDKIRAFHQIRAMAARHEVDVFTLADEAVKPADQSALAGHCHRLTVARLNPRFARLRSLPFLLTRTPLTLPYFYSRELGREIRQAVLARSYDRVFVYCSAMAQYVAKIERIPILLDLVDVDSDKWTQYAAFAKFPLSAVYRREGRYLREYERKVCERASKVFVTTGREAELVRQISDGAPVHVIPNGVDTNYFDPLVVPPDSAAAPGIIFTGDMSYFPNEEAVTFFAHQVLPLIRRSVPGVRFLIVGRNPGARVQRLRDIEGVEVTGFVPDVRTYLARARVAVAPFSIAAGIQNKILEAMSYGLPVVATARAVQGLSANAAEVIETGDSAEELAAKTARLLGDPELARQKGLEGRRRVSADYRWDESGERLLHFLESSTEDQAHPSTVLMLLANAYDPDPRVRQEALALIRLGYRVRLLAWDRDRKRPAFEGMEGVAVERVFVSSSHGRGATQLFFYAWLYWKMLWRGWRTSFDVVHCHDLDMLPLGFVLGKIKRKPVVYDAHESFPDMLEGSVPRVIRAGLVKLENFLIRRIDLLITVGEKLRRHFAERGARRSVVVGNWKRLQDFSRSEHQNLDVRRRLGIADGALVVVCITQLLKDRKIEELLGAIDECPDTYLILGGKGVLQEFVEQWARKNPRVIYAGFVTGKQIADYTCAGDIVYYGFDPENPNARFSAPNKLFEALAAAKPLITGDFGEIADVVRQCSCGVVLSRYDGDEIVKALASLRSAEVRRTMALNARQFGSAVMNWEKGEEILDREYSGLLRREPRDIASAQTPLPSTVAANVETSEGIGGR